MWRGRGFGFGRGAWGAGPGFGWGRGNPTPYCRAYPWLPKGWWAYSANGPWATAPYGVTTPFTRTWNVAGMGWNYGNPAVYRW